MQTDKGTLVNVHHTYIITHTGTAFYGSINGLFTKQVGFKTVL